MAAKPDPALKAEAEAEYKRLHEVSASEAPPTIADLIQAARKATQYANDLQAEVDAARSAARNAFDAVYDELARLKVESKNMDTFRSSKLGKLLEGIR
jgi:glutathione S-transferase